MHREDCSADTMWGLGPGEVGHERPGPHLQLRQSTPAIKCGFCFWLRPALVSLAVTPYLAA
eukprot:956794-Rhodomonas_salina.1